MASLIRRVSSRKVSPRRSGPHDPKHGIQHIPRVTPRATSLWSWGTPLSLWEEWFDDGPLLLREIHPDGRSEKGAVVDRLLEAIGCRVLTATRLRDTL